jgi:hypothetical protein
MRYSEIVSEAVGDQFLYHGTSPRNAAKILRMNTLAGRTKQLYGGWRGRFKDKDIDKAGGEDAVMGVSFTRNLRFVQQWTSQSSAGSAAASQGVPGVIFVLDAAKLKQRYRVTPVEYFQRSGASMNRAEAEEFVAGDIKNLSNYIHEIQVPAATYAFMQRNDQFNEYSDLLKNPKIKVLGKA